MGLAIMLRRLTGRPGPKLKLNAHQRVGQSDDEDQGLDLFDVSDFLEICLRGSPTFGVTRDFNHADYPLIEGLLEEVGGVRIVSFGKRYASKLHIAII